MTVAADAVPLRFLMVISAYPPAKTAGMERGCQRLAEALARRGHGVQVLTQKGEGLPERAEEQLGLIVHRVIKPLALGPLWGITYMSQVERWMHRLAGDWDFSLCQKLYIHSLSANRACRALGRPSASLLVNAGDWSDIAVLRRHRGGESLLRKALKADAFFALSRQSRQELLAEGVPAGKVFPYHYFVDAETFRPASRKPESPLLLFVGRFHPQKNIPLLIEAFEQIHSELPEIRLRLVGKGPEEDTVRARIEKSPAKAAIEVRGWSDDPAMLYREATAVVTASNAEGLSNVLLEAMASGAPVVTTDVSGARDALDPQEEAPGAIAEGEFFRGRGGLIVPIGDKRALVGALKQVISDPSLRTTLSAEARTRVVETFSEEAVVPRFISDAQRIAGGIQ